MVTLIRQPWREADRYRRRGLWHDTTLPDLLNANATGDGEGRAYVQGDAVLTWTELRDAAGSLAATLLDHGCEAGDVVVIVLGDGPEFVAAMAAAQALGAVAAPLSSGTGPADVRNVVDRTGARVVVTDGEVGADVHAAVVRPGAIRDWPIRDERFPPRGHVMDADVVADLMFTSGTTGRPKGAMNSANTKLSGLRGLLEVYPFDASDVWGVIPSMAHNAGWLYTALPAIATRAPLVSVGRGDPVAMLDSLERHRVTATFLVPTHVSDLVATYKAHPGRWQLSVRHVITGAAPSQAGVLREAAELWGMTPISMYGMTECQGNLFTRPDDPPDVWATTVGRPCPGSEVALRDVDTGELVHGDGAIGEVVTRGATTFLGYFDDEAATASSFTADGWFRSGDVGTWVGDSLRIVGRIKEVILRGGQTIVPDEMELGFADMEGIGRVVVLGLPDDRLGERTCLVVTGRVPSADELHGHMVAKGLGRHLLPDEVRRLESVPTTDLGKAKRSELRALLLSDG